MQQGTSSDCGATSEHGVRSGRWIGSSNKQLPAQSEQVLSYLEQRAAEPCTRSMIRRARAARAFYEESAGVQLASRTSECPWMAKQADAHRSNSHRNEERASVAKPLNLPGFRGAPGHEPRPIAGLAFATRSGDAWRRGQHCVSLIIACSRQQVAASLRHLSGEHCRERRPPKRIDRSNAECFTSAATAGF